MTHKLHIAGRIASFSACISVRGVHAEVLKRTMDGTTQLTAEDLMGWSQSNPGDIPSSLGRAPRMA